VLGQKTLKELLHYNPDTGDFTWLISKGVKAGTVVKYSIQGHIYVRIHGRSYPIHRLAFLYMTGEFPVDQVDHINNIRSDNRFINLRECNSFENTCNSPLRSDNTSGAKGVHWDSKNSKWYASICAKKTRYFLGRFDDFELAEFVINEARDILHGEFANNG